VTQLLISPQEYEALLKALKERIRSAQLQALRSVNSELISLYADIGVTTPKVKNCTLRIVLSTKGPRRPLRLRRLFPDGRECASHQECSAKLWFGA
jgi:hypothetical protein